MAEELPLAVDGVAAMPGAYLDYAATTPLDERVLEAMLPYLTRTFANAGSLHSPGKAARHAVEESRHAIAARLGIRDPYEIVFTSGGTESDNAAVKGIAIAARDRMSKSAGPGHVVCSAFEHKAVLESVAGLRSLGFEIDHVMPRADGTVRPEDLEPLMRPDTVLVSVMLANNEVGTVSRVGELAEVAHGHGAFFHTDAVAALGKVPVDVRALGVDALSFTAHKICGPKGIGGLYLSKRVPFVAQLRGGGQERGKRSGTYDTASIVGLARAVELALDDGALDAEAARLSGLRDGLLARLVRSSQRVSPVVDIPAGDVDGHVPGLLPVVVSGIESETLLARLDDAGFAVSSGSACTSESNKPSYVLESMGLVGERAAGFLRISMGRFTTQDEADAFARALLEAIGGK